MKLVLKPIRQVEIPIIVLAQFVIILYYLPYFILGENASICLTSAKSELVITLI